MISNGWLLEVSREKYDISLASLAFSLITLAILWYKFGKDTPPGPRGLPLVGYLPFRGTNLHLEFTKISQRYGPIFKLKLGSKSFIVISSSDLAKVVVREQDEIFANRDPPVAGLVLFYGGQSILWSDNNSFLRNMRKVFVYQVQSKKNLEASRSFRRGGVREAVKHVYETIGSEVDIGTIAFSTSLSVITSMLWGKSLVEYEKHSKLGVGVEFRDVICRIVELLGAANLSDFFPVLSRFDLQGVEREMKKQWKLMDEILERMIEERLQFNATKQEESVEQQERKDFLQILLEHKETNTGSTFSTITQIKAHLMEIIVGGTDTTSTMAEWTMAELLRNPDVLKKIQEELEQVVGLNHMVEESHIPRLNYLDAVIKETFRLHPPLPLLIGRSPSQSCKVGGYTIPKGSSVYLNVWAIHRDSEYWENPLQFDPNRFLNPDTTAKFDYSGNNTNFLPIGSGRRRCPGFLLGEKMLVYFLASMLHSFDWSLRNEKEHELSDKFGIVLKKRKPVLAIPSQRLSHKNLYL